MLLRVVVGCGLLGRELLRLRLELHVRGLVDFLFLAGWAVELRRLGPAVALAHASAPS
jgi:hypothetical protein